MRDYPESKYEFKELKELNAKDWMIELLKKNPLYTGWGNFEDYMMVNHGDEWTKAIELDSFSELKKLDKNNEVVNFYFEITRPNHECEYCKGTGYNEKTKELSDNWYSVWQYDLTQEETDMLWEKGRLNSYFNHKPTAKELNNLSRNTFVHDCINRHLCIKARAERLGVYGDCPRCNSGYVYDSPDAKVSLQLWVIHPENGASQGVYIKEIKKEEVDEVLQYLKEAGKRLSDKFSKIETHSETVECLASKNNTATLWGNHRGYMAYDETSGWTDPVDLESVSELWELDDYNELVDFYFELDEDENGNRISNFQMWFIHPRKGASRGVLLKGVKDSDIKIIVDYLEGAKNRNVARFKKL